MYLKKIENTSIDASNALKYTANLFIGKFKPKSLFKVFKIYISVSHNYYNVIIHNYKIFYNLKNIFSIFL